MVVSCMSTTKGVLVNFTAAASMLQGAERSSGASVKHRLVGRSSRTASWCRGEELRAERWSLQGRVVLKGVGYVWRPNNIKRKRESACAEPGTCAEPATGGPGNCEANFDDHAKGRRGARLCLYHNRPGTCDEMFHDRPRPVYGGSSVWRRGLPVYRGDLRGPPNKPASRASRGTYNQVPDEFYTYLGLSRFGFAARRRCRWTGKKCIKRDRSTILVEG